MKKKVEINFFHKRNFTECREKLPRKTVEAQAICHIIAKILS